MMVLPAGRATAKSWVFPTEELGFVAQGVIKSAWCILEWVDLFRGHRKLV